MWQKVVAEEPAYKEDVKRFVIATNELGRLRVQAVETSQLQ
jgi:hypothetical protein